MAVCCPSVESPLNRMQRVVVYGSTNEWIQLFLACHRELWWVRFCSSYIPAKCLSRWRTDYMTMQMTTHYWHIVRKTADRPAVAASLLTGTLIGFRSGAITGAWYWILTTCTKVLVVSVSRTVNVSLGESACGVAKAIYKQFAFSTWTCTADFTTTINNNNSNNNNNYHYNII